MKIPISIPNLSSRPFELHVERVMKLPPQQIYWAWTERIDSWFAAPGSALMEPKVDAVFFFQTEFHGNFHPHYGRFLKLEQDRLVQLTWLTSGTLGFETVVTLELDVAGEGTQLRLTHSGFPDEASRDAHQQAWPMVLEQLDVKMSG